MVIKRSEPAKLGAFPYQTTTQLRWRDADVYGHINNVVHYEIFDTTVNAWAMSRGLLDPLCGASISLVVESGCKYHAEILLTQRVTVGLRVASVGRSSVRYEIGLFRENEESAAAEGYFVHVLVDRRSRRPVPLGDAFSRALSELAFSG